MVEEYCMPNTVQEVLEQLEGIKQRQIVIGQNFDVCVLDCCIDKLKEITADVTSQLRCKDGVVNDE